MAFAIASERVSDQSDATSCNNNITSSFGVILIGQLHFQTYIIVGSNPLPPPPKQFIYHSI